MANKEIQARVKHKRDTSANWTKNNPVLLNGEIVLVDTAEGELRAKIGDGIKTYTQLPFSDEALRSLITNNKGTVDEELSSTSTNPVQNKTVTTEINGLKTLVGDTSVANQISAAVQAMLPKVTTITLGADWIGTDSPYYQDVTLSCVTETSVIDLQPTPTQLVEWQDAGIAFTTQSGDGAARVYVAGTKPTTEISVQVKVQEVVQV